MSAPEFPKPITRSRWSRNFSGCLYSRLCMIFPLNFSIPIKKMKRTRRHYSYDCAGQDVFKVFEMRKETGTYVSDLGVLLGEHKVMVLWSTWFL